MRNQIGLMLVFAVALFCPTTYGEDQWEAIKLRWRIEDAKAMKLNAQIAELYQRIEDAKSGVKTEIVKQPEQVAITEKEEQVIDEPKEIVPQDPPKEVLAVPESPELVNILFIDDYGRVPECFKGVRVSDITQDGKHTHFLFEGKPIDWNQKVVFSYSYMTNEVSIIGAIYYTPEIGGASSKVINVPPCNVYQDSDGTIRYDDGAGRYPLAPKGSGYITAQCVLPTQP